MAFITFNMLFTDGDDESRENLGLDPKVEEGEITVNTNHICAYNENSENNCTMLRMNNGEIYPCPLPIKEFEEWLGSFEIIEKLPNITSN